MQLIETNDDGTVTPAPVVEWLVAPLAGTLVVLGVRYLQQKAEGVAECQIQVTLTPQQALDIAGSLTRASGHVLIPEAGGVVH